MKIVTYKHKILNLLLPITFERTRDLNSLPLDQKLKLYYYINYKNIKL